MRTIPSLALFTLLTMNQLFAEAEPTELQVLTDLDAAKAQSKETGKPIFLEFMSSNCPHCQAFKKTVLSDPAFVAYANKNLIIVIHDYQQLSKLPASEKAARKALMVEFKVEAFPTILLIDKTNQTLLRTEGYSGTSAKEFIASLQNATAGKSTKVP